MDDLIWSGFGNKKKRQPNLGLGLGKPAKKSRDTRRGFTPTQKKEIQYQQGSKCARCHEKLDPRSIQYDHKKAWAAGGRTIIVNGRALCGKCHDIVTHEQRIKKIDKKRKPKKSILDTALFTRAPKMPKYGF